MPITPVHTVTVMPPPPPQPCMFHLDQYFDEAHLQFVCKELEGRRKGKRGGAESDPPRDPGLPSGQVPGGRSLQQQMLGGHTAQPLTKEQSRFLASLLQPLPAAWRQKRGTSGFPGSPQGDSLVTNRSPRARLPVLGEELPGC